MHCFHYSYSIAYSICLIHQAYDFCILFAAAYFWSGENASVQSFLPTLLFRHRQPSGSLCVELFPIPFVVAHMTRFIHHHHYDINYRVFCIFSQYDNYGRKCKIKSVHIIWYDIFTQPHGHAHIRTVLHTSVYINKSTWRDHVFFNSIINGKQIQTNVQEN